MKIPPMKKSVKNKVFNTFQSLNYVLNIFGLSWIYQDGEKLKYSYSIWKILILIITFMVMNICSIYFKIQYYDGPIKITFRDSFQIFIFIGYIQFLVDVTLVFKHGKQTCVNYYCLYEYIDNILGMKYCETVKKSITKMCYFFIFIGIITIITDFTAFTWSFGWEFPISYSVEYVYLGLRMLTDLDMISNLTQMKYRIKTVGDQLEDYYCNTNNAQGVVKDVVFNKVWITPGEKKKQNDLDNLRTGNSSKHNIVLWLSRCYLLLIEQCEYINTMFGIRLLISCISHLLDMIFLVNLLIRLITGTMITTYNSSTLPIISTIMRITTIVLIAFCGINRCEQNYRENERIVRLIDHVVINKKTSKEIQETLRELKNLIISRPINYHTNNFFRLDYGTMVSLASVVVTYSIILLQSIQ